MMKVYSFCAGELGTNSIVLVKNDKCIVVDVPYGADSVEKFISDNQLQLVAVLLTHGHFDHVGGVQRLIDRFGCSDLPVFIHGADEKLANCASQNRWSVKAENCYPTKHVSKGHYSVDCFDFDVIETPGHTAGSVCYVFDEYNLLVSGVFLLPSRIKYHIGAYFCIKAVFVLQFLISVPACKIIAVFGGGCRFCDYGVFGGSLSCNFAAAVCFKAYSIIRCTAAAAV